MWRLGCPGGGGGVNGTMTSNKYLMFSGAQDLFQCFSICQSRPIWGSNDLCTGVACIIRYPENQIFTFAFLHIYIPIAKLQWWRSRENNFMVVAHHNMRNCIPLETHKTLGCGWILLALVRASWEGGRPLCPSAKHVTVSCVLTPQEKLQGHYVISDFQIIIFWFFWSWCVSTSALLTLSF